MPANLTVPPEIGYGLQDATHRPSLKTTCWGVSGYSEMQGHDRDIQLWLVLFICLAAQSNCYLSAWALHTGLTTLLEVYALRMCPSFGMHLCHEQYMLCQLLRSL